MSLMEKIYIFNELTKIFYSILSCTKLRGEMTGIAYNYKVQLCLLERREKQARQDGHLMFGILFWGSFCR